MNHVRAVRFTSWVMRDIPQSGGVIMADLQQLTGLAEDTPQVGMVDLPDLL